MNKSWSLSLVDIQVSWTTDKRCWISLEKQIKRFTSFLSMCVDIVLLSLFKRMCSRSFFWLFARQGIGGGEENFDPSATNSVDRHTKSVMSGQTTFYSVLLSKLLLSINSFLYWRGRIAHSLDRFHYLFVIEEDRCCFSSSHRIR